MKLYILAYGAAFAVLSAGAMAQTSGSQRTQEHGPGQMLDYPHEKRESESGQRQTDGSSWCEYAG